MARARWAALGCWTLSSCVSALAHAEEPATVAAPTYALSWVRAEGAEDCPNGRALALEVERRLGRPVFDAAAERSFEVEVTRLGNTHRSDVYVRDAFGHTIGHRSLQSDEPGCGALLNATALAVALVIDPEAGAHAPPPRESVGAFEPPRPAAPPITPSLPAPPPTPHEPPTVALRAPVTAPPTLITASMRAQITGGLVGATSPGFELSFSARPSERWGVAISGSYTLAQTVTRGVGSLELGLTRMSAQVTFDAGHSERVRLVLTAGPTLGALHVAVRRPVPVTAPGDYGWLAGQLGIWTEVAVAKGLFLELGGSGLVPLVRRSLFVRGQSEAVFRPPLLAGVGFLGLGARFP